MLKKLLFASVLFLSVTAVKASLCSSNGNGPWIPAPLIWSCGHMPGCNDSIAIRGTDSVWISNSIDYTSPPFSCGVPMFIKINGTLGFQTGKKLDLPAGSVVTITAGGKIDPGTGGGSANLISIGGVTVWTSAYGTVSGPLVINQSTPLPIELIYFAASKCDHSVCVEWKTATETNNDFFSVERTTDGLNFELLAQIDGAGNSSSVRSYSYTDNFPAEGVSYYRLKQTDFNGVFTYSNLSAINFSEDKTLFFEVYPNPNTGENINISLNGGAAGEEVLVVVTDITGKESYSKVVILEVKDENVIAMDNSKKLSPGVYFITATSRQNIYNKRMVVN